MYLDWSESILESYPSSKIQIHFINQCSLQINLTAKQNIGPCTVIAQSVLKTRSKITESKRHKNYECTEKARFFNLHRIEMEVTRLIKAHEMHF